MKFHEKLYTLRKNAGMTQSDLAEKLNVSRQAVSRWEMGTAMPEIENLVAMSDLFGVTLDELLRDREEPPEGETPPEPPQPRYWDLVPRKWWVFGVLALVFQILPQLLVIGVLANPQGFVAAASLITVCSVLKMISLCLLAACFLFPLIRWLKARK